MLGLQDSIVCGSSSVDWMWEKRYRVTYWLGLISMHFSESDGKRRKSQVFGLM